MGEEKATYFAASLALPGAGLGLLRSDPSLERVVAQAGLAQRRLELRIPWSSGYELVHYSRKDTIYEQNTLRSQGMMSAFCTLFALPFTSVAVCFLPCESKVLDFLTSNWLPGSRMINKQNETYLTSLLLVTPP